MIAYRIEHKETGLGPYVGNGILQISGSRHQWWNKPVPNWRLGMSQCSFGFISKRQLKEWFDCPKSVRKLWENGYRVVRYECKSEMIKYSDPHQIAFRKDLARKIA